MIRACFLSDDLIRDINQTKTSLALDIFSLLACDERMYAYV